MAARAPLHRRGGRPWRAAAALVVALVATACTSDEPAPTTPSPTPSTAPAVEEDVGDRVAIVVAPPSDVAEVEAAALLAAGEMIAADLPDGVAELRVVRAVDRQFTADLVALFVDGGFDLVCVVGSGAAALALDAARRHRATTICATDLAIEGGPSNVVAVAVDPRALVTAAGAATAAAPAPVGLVVAPAVGAIDVLEPLLTSLLPEPPPPPTPSPTATDAGAAGSDDASAEDASPPPSQPPPTAVVGASTVDGRDDAFAAVGSSAAAVAVVLVPDSGEDVAALGAGGIASVVVEDWVADPDGALPRGVVVGLTVDRARQLRAAIEAARSPERLQVSLLRLGDGVLGAVPGPGPGAAEAVARVLTAVETAADTTG